MPNFTCPNHCVIFPANQEMKAKKIPTLKVMDQHISDPSPPLASEYIASVTIALLDGLDLAPICQCHYYAAIPDFCEVF